MTKKDLEAKFHKETGKYVENCSPSEYVTWLEEELINFMELEEAILDFAQSSEVF